MRSLLDKHLPRKDLLALSFLFMMLGNTWGVGMLNVVL